MSDTQTFEKYEVLLSQLKMCLSKKEIDDVFEKANITSLTDRIYWLNKSMGVERSFGTPEKVTPEQDYDFDCAVFVEGTWRMLN